MTEYLTYVFELLGTLIADLAIFVVVSLPIIGILSGIAAMVYVLVKYKKNKALN